MVSRILRKLTRSDLVESTSVQRLRKFQGRSGELYEIDVSYRFSVAGASYLTVVECKCWNKRVGRDVISAFKSVIDDIGAHKGIVVTTVGFQKGALQVAPKYGIALYKVSNQHPYATEYLTQATGNEDSVLKYLANESSPISRFGFVWNRGISYYSEHISEYARKRYGDEVANYLANEKITKLADIEDEMLREKVTNKFRDMEKNLFLEYLEKERFGISDFSVGPDLELRVLNLKIFGAYMEVGNEDAIVELIPRREYRKLTNSSNRQTLK